MNNQTPETAAYISGLSWMYAEACRLMDNGKDIRNAEVSELFGRALKAMGESTPK